MTDKKELINSRCVTISYICRHQIFLKNAPKCLEITKNMYTIHPSVHIEYIIVF